MEENPAAESAPQTPVKQMMVDIKNAPNLTCRFCMAPTPPGVFFCPTCGKKLQEPPFTFSWAKFIGNMTLTILLPPMGIFPGIRHLRKDDQTAKILGITYIIVTVIATVVMLKITMDFVNNINEELNSTYLMQDYLNNPSGSVENQAEQLQQLEQ